MRPLPEKKYDTTAKVIDEIKQLAMGDRDVMEKAQRAFVTFVRAYKEHRYVWSWRF